MELEEGYIVLCTVDKIEKTNVFVNIEGNGQGSIILSEIAPGRIRNLRDYVVPKKKIVCKVLRIRGNNIELSLRRVSLKERKDILEEYKQEKSYLNVLKSVLGDKVENIINKIIEKERLYDFLQNAKQEPEKLESLVGKADSEKILIILKKEKQKKITLKKEIYFTTKEPDGIEIIKKILKETPEIKIDYIAAGKYSIKIESNEIKKSDAKLKEFLNEIEKKAKKMNAEFSVKEK
ncbi:MAG: hypothetical protein WC584_04215 [Candidatus Pacearchaeota archaeon]